MPLEVMHFVPNACTSDGIFSYARAIGARGRCLTGSKEYENYLTSARTILLHYSGYGYNVHGVPWQLFDSLSKWRKACSERRLLIVFHELVARQPPWRKGFWLAPFQQRLLRRLIAICDGGVSTLELHSSWLRSQGLIPFATMPVPSNVGESHSLLPLPQRCPHLVVFGGASQRHAAYAALRRHPSLLEQLAITTIHDVGPPLDRLPHHPQLPIKCHGLLNEAEVAELLCQSLLAAVSYPLPFLAKSGIFAALCAHGTLPLVLNAGRCGAAQADGLRAGHTFITPAWLRAQSDPATALAAATPIAASAWHWYQPHRLSEQRGIVEAWLATLT